MIINYMHTKLETELEVYQAEVQNHLEASILNFRTLQENEIRFVSEIVYSHRELKPDECMVLTVSVAQGQLGSFKGNEYAVLVHDAPIFFGHELSELLREEKDKQHSNLNPDHLPPLVDIIIPRNIWPKDEGIDDQTSSTVGTRTPGAIRFFLDSACRASFMYIKLNPNGSPSEKPIIVYPSIVRNVSLEPLSGDTKIITFRAAQHV